LAALAFTQLGTPADGVAARALLTLAPILTPLALLAIFRVTARAVVTAGMRCRPS
jgi:hypothetical protein